MANTASIETRRPVNCRVAFDVRGDLVLGVGADGIPERMMTQARLLDNPVAEYRVLGVAITDVETGEQWLYPLHYEGSVR